MNETLLEAMARSIVDGDEATSANLARQALAQGMSPLTVLSDGYVVGINEVGERFSQGDAYIPDLIVAGAAMEAAMVVIQPELAKLEVAPEEQGIIVLATVEGDIHDIGKNIVHTMLSSSGFTVYDLGADVPVANIIEKVREVQADIVAVSALLTTTMVRQEEVVKALKEAGLRDSVKVIVGGAPVTQEWVETIGADGFSEDAVGAVAVAKTILGRA